MIEQLTNRYRLLAQLGQGGMGTVYLAEDATTGEQVALKTLSLKQAGDRHDALLRFRQEFKAMARLRHEHLVAVHDFGELSDGTPYFTMEVVPGRGLDECLPLDPATAQVVAVQLCRALSPIHRQGMVHCDLKPENVRLMPDGRIKLMDFGLMSPAGQSGGAIKGTLAYMAPETARRSKVDARSDLYSLGAVLYHLLSGRVPFPGDDPMAVLRAHVETPPEPLIPLCPQVPAALEEVVLRLLAKDPLHRFQSTDDVLVTLGAVPEGESEGTLFASPFVGRSAMLDEFDRRLSTPGIWRLSGAAGMGKTRLLEEFRFRGQLSGRAVLGGRAAEDGLPYGAMLGILRGAIALATPEVLDPLRTPLSGLLPDLSTDGEAVQLDPQKEKARLHGAIATLLSGVTGDGLLVLIDDWQWADTGSQELIAHLERSLSSQLVTFVLAGREATDDSTALAPFEGPEVAEMAGAMLGGDHLDAGFVAQLGEATAGNPFFVERAIRHLWQEGVLRYAHGRWNTAGLVLSASALPADVHDLLVRRLSHLSREAQELAELAAVLAHPFPLGRIRRLLDADDDRLFEAIVELAREGILREDEGVLRFAGGQHAEVIGRRIAPDRRTELHTRIAAVLVEELGDDDRLESLFELARHHLASADPAKGVGFALAAARKSYALYGLPQAKQMLEAGLPHVSGPADRLGYLTLLGDIARISSDLDSARGRYEEALGLARSLAQPGTEATLLTNLGILHQIKTDYPAAIARVQEALALTRDPAHAPERLRALLRLGALHHFTGDPAASITVHEEALALARDIGDLASMSSALGFLGLLFVQGAPDRLETGLTYLLESCEIKEQLGDKIGLSDSTSLLGNAQLALGHYSEAFASFLRNHALCVEIGIRDDETCALLNLGMCAYELGRFADSARFGAEAHAAARVSGNPLYTAIGLAIEAVAQAHLGRFDDAVRVLEEVDALAASSANSYMAVLVATYGIEVELLLGRLTVAMARCARAEALEAESGITEYRPRRLALEAELLVRFGEREAATSLLEGLAEWAIANHARGWKARAALGLAMLSVRRDEPERSIEVIETAIAEAEACGAGYLVTLGHWLRGQGLLRLGYARPAAETFSAAMARAEELSCPRLVVVARFGLAQVEGRSPKGYLQLNLVRHAVTALLEGTQDAERRADILALDELWRAHRGDLSPDVTPAAAGAIAESKYLAAVQEARALHQRLGDVELAHHQLQRLVTFASDTHNLTDLETLLELIVTQVVELAGAERGFVILEEDGKLRVKASTVDPATRDPRQWQYSESIVERVFSEGRSLFFADAAEGADAARSVMNLQIRTVLCVPLINRDRRLGVIYVDRRLVKSQFGEPDKRLVEMLALQAAQALDNARLYAEGEAHSHQLEMLNTLARTVSTTLVLSEVLDSIIGFTLQLTQADRAFILLTDDGEALRCHLAKDRSGQVIGESGEKVSSSITRRVLTTFEPECVLDTRDHELFQAQQSILDLNLRTVMCVPLVVKQEALGVLYVDSQAVVHTFGPRDLDLLRSIASQASVAIQNARLYERATIDGLTKLYVRSYFEQRLSAELRRVNRFGTTMSLMMMDIDHFKKFNDTYGHATGDDVLKLVARVIREGIREELDIPGRFGGEEMLVMMPETDAAGAMVLAERLRHAIETTDLPGPNGEVLHVEVSIGVASIPTHARTVVELIEHADQALYVSKRGGRNRVTLYDPATVSGN
jgi:diguanylate cyclase (GGDEF)-like protein